MGRTLYITHHEFREHLDKSIRAVEKYIKRPLLPILFDENDFIHQTKYTQPLLFALEYALYTLWTSWGVVPYAVLGHSVGEYVAACAAGIFSLDEAAYLITERGRLIQEQPTTGAMYSVFSDEYTVCKHCYPFGGDVSIAAINGPQHVVISGNEAENAANLLISKNISVHKLNVSHSFHSAVMDGMLDSFAKVANIINYSPPNIAFISNITGKQAFAETVGSGTYWTQHVRGCVRFASSVTTLAELGCTVALEIGPSPILCGLGTSCINGDIIKWLPTLRRGAEWEQLTKSVAEMYASGVQIDWKAFERPWPQKRLNLPTYPFQRKRYWLTETQNLSSASSHCSSSATDLSCLSKESGDYSSDMLLLEDSAEQKNTILQKLSMLLSAILGYADATVLPKDKNIVELGLDSLMAFRVQAGIRKSFGVLLPLTLFFRNATLLSIVESILHHVPENIKHERIDQFIQSDEKYAPFPLTDVQYAYWIGRSGELQFSDISCFVYLEVDVKNLDLERFEKALNLLIQRHDMLRAIILPNGEQQIREEVLWNTVIAHDLRSFSNNKKKGEQSSSPFCFLVFEYKTMTSKLKIFYKSWYLSK